MDGTRYLTDQHRALEQSLREALVIEDAGARRSRVHDIGDALAMHLAAEEQVFYPAVHRRPNEDLLLESLEEHLAIKRLLADLVDLDSADPTFQAKLHVLKEQVEHHHREEEEKLFPRVRKELPAERREELGAEMQALQASLQQQGRPRLAVLDQTGTAEPLR